MENAELRLNDRCGLIHFLRPAASTDSKSRAHAHNTRSEKLLCYVYRVPSYLL